MRRGWFRGEKHLRGFSTVIHTLNSRRHTTRDANVSIESKRNVNELNDTRKLIVARTRYYRVKRIDTTD